MHQVVRKRRYRLVKTGHYGLALLLAYALIATGIGNTSVRAIDRKTATPDAPTRVTLHKFDAYSYRDVVSLEWQSAYELDNLGYNVYREQDGVRVQLNPSLIAGSALQAGQHVALTAGNTYAWRGKSAGGKQTQSVAYWLESIDLNLRSTWYGPVFAKIGDDLRAVPPQSKLFADYSQEPQNREQREWPSMVRGVSHEIRKAYREWINKDVSYSLTDEELSRFNSSPELDTQWELAAQDAVKIAVNRDGWQRVSRAELLAAGLNPNANLVNLKLYVDGVEQAMAVNADGSIEFYGESLLTASTDTSIYWLVPSLTHGKRVSVSTAGPYDPNVQPASFPYTVERTDRTIRFPALLNGAAQNFFGPVINAAPMKQTLQVTSLDPTAVQGQLVVGAQGLTLQAHQVKVQINGFDVGFINFNGRENGVGQFTVPTTQLRENKNTITLTGIAPASDVSLIDFVRLTYPRKYEASSNRLLFSVPAGQPVKGTGFTTSNLRVLDVTDTANVSELTVSPQADAGGFAFTLPGVGTARTLFAIGASGSFDHPIKVSHNEPSSWHQATHEADLLIITYRDFRQSIEPLRLLRESQGLRVAVVDVEDVFDEFSYGAHSPQALKDFIQRAKTLWPIAPRYLLLVGDGTADPRDYLRLGSVDLVPTMMVDSLFSESPSDDVLTDFDNNGIGDLATGRFPVNTSAEATLIVNKILTYEQAPAGDTQQRGAVMVSDITDANYDFVAFTNQVRLSLPAMMAVQFINRADGDTPTIRAQILSAINLGPGVVNFLGHGSVGVWTGAGILAITDPPTFTNNPRLSLFVMMTCLNGAFTEVGTDSLAEAIIRAPNGGGVSVWASTGLTVPFGQVDVSKQFYELLFSGQAQRVGDATKAAKLATNDMDVRRLSILFGDPTMRFR